MTFDDYSEKIKIQTLYNFSRLQVNLWPQPYHQNDRKKTENLLIYILKKMLIFDQKILEVANYNHDNDFT